MAVAKTDTRQSKSYYWSGIDDAGSRVKNRKIVAADERAAVTALQRAGCVPTKMKASGGMDLNMQIGGEPKLKWGGRAEFARRLFQLQRAGVALPSALLSMAEGQKPMMAEMYQELAEKVSAGATLSSAMLAYPKAFDEVTVAYISSGERTGALEEALERLSVLLARRAAMAAKVKGVMAYPVMVGSVIILLVTGIVMFLVPSYADIYKSFGAKLPTPTLMLIVLSKNMLPVFGWDTEGGYPDAPFTLNIPFFNDYAALAVVGVRIPGINIGVNPLAVFAVVAMAIFGWKTFRKRTADNQQVNIFLDRVKFRMPVLGGLNALSALFRWASTLAGGLQTGVPQTDAVDLAARASGSKWYQALVPEFVSGLRAGRPLSAMMAENDDLFPVNVRTMVSTGESTGDVETMLDSVSESLSEDIDALTAGLSAKIEVALLVIMGVVVGGLLIILYLPILQLASTASSGMGGG